MNNVVIFSEDEKIERAFLGASIEFFRNDNNQIVVKVNNIYFPTNIEKLYIDMKINNNGLSLGPFCLKRVSTSNNERLYELYDFYRLEDGIVCTDDLVPQKGY